MRDGGSELTDGGELFGLYSIYGSDPNLADTDGDGRDDLFEVLNGTNPAVPD